MSKVETMTELEKAYLAGFMDGEGTIAIYTPGGTFSPMVGVANTHRETLLTLQNFAGGSLYKSGPKTLACKQGYSLTWPGKRGIEICKDLLPYLITKKKQAELLVQFPIGVRILGDRNLTVSDEDNLLRAILCNLLHELNKKGDIENGEDPLSLEIC